MMNKHFKVPWFKPFAWSSIAAVAAILGDAGNAHASPTLYKIDPVHTGATFRVKHMGAAHVTGTVTGAAGTLLVDDDDPKSAVLEVTLDVASIQTGVAKRDAHLRGEDFFDVEHFPKMTFRSTRVEKGSDGWTVVGDLTIKGVTRTGVAFAVESPSPLVKNPAGALVRGTSAVGKIKRSDFGLTWNKLIEGVELVGDEIRLTLDIELIRTADQPKP